MDNFEQSTLAPGIGSAEQAPPASAFPAHPAAWYFFCHLTELKRRPVGRRHLQRDLVAFITKNGTVAVLDAHCSHLGANLAYGQVVGETLECPFHNWCFGTDGACRKIPSSGGIPVFARQHSFPVAVRHGTVFFFNGPEATFPLPFFEGENPDDFKSATSFSYSADAGWLMVASQGFDRQHIETVHDRRLLRGPELRRLSPFALRTCYEAEIIGESLRDRILALLVGRKAQVTIHNWGGTMFCVKAEFLRVCSRFLVSFRPMEDGRTHFDVLVFVPHDVSSLSLHIRRWFTREHLVSEAAQIRGTEYRPKHLIAADADMIECFRWLAAMPQHRIPSLEVGHPGISPETLVTTNI